MLETVIADKPFAAVAASSKNIHTVHLRLWEKIITKSAFDLMFVFALHNAVLAEVFPDC